MHKQTNEFYGKIFPWVLLVVVTISCFVFWGMYRDWSFEGITALQLFPVLGMYAWSIMWTHYAVGSIRILNSEVTKNKIYSKVSGYIVLGLILLHPGLLIWNQWSKSGIKPPESIYGYVDDSLKVFVFIGTLSLLIFLSFEVFRRMISRPIVKKYWNWVSLSQMLAMTLIFIHGMTLGGILDDRYAELYWVVLGALLIPCFGLIVNDEWINKQSKWLF